MDEETQRFLREADQRGSLMPSERRGDMEKLVEALLENEEMDREEVEKLLGIVRPADEKARAKTGIIPLTSPV